MRDFRVHKLPNWVDWWPDLVVHEGPFWQNGYYTINPGVARAHLAPGESWWG